tara:strand:+ start:139 stop:708 length:570 start_codon:yes stop_codon:yes gene_type:complete
MAQFIMLPDGVDGTNEWHASSGSDFAKLVTSDDGVSNYVYEQASAYQEITFTMANPSVAEADIDFDEDVSVQAHMKADYTFVGGTDLGAPHTYSYLKIQITGTGISIAASSKTLTTEDGSYPLYSGSATTNQAFLTPWDYDGLENCQIKLENTSRPARYHPIRVTYVYITVDYTSLVAADNATFFGANF